MRKSDKGMKFFGVIVILAIIVSVFGGVVSAEEVVVYDKKVKVDSRQESTAAEDLTYMATEPATDSTSDVAYGAINPDYRISDSPYLRLPADMTDLPSIVPPEPHEVKGAENPTAVEIYNVATGEVIRLPITNIAKQPFFKSTPPYQGLLPPGVVPKTVFPPDDRTRISSTTTYPWRTICKLFFTFPDDSVWIGSGAIIDGYHVLTAGHCVHSRDNGGWATSVKVVPGLDEDYMPYSYAWATYLRSYTEWTEDKDHRHDWALITLDRNVGDYTGWMGRQTASPSSSIYTGGLNTAGYPGDKGGITMWFDADTGRTANEYNHWYYMDTYGGQSGSPVWRYVDPTRYILTVHAYADDGSGSNHGTRLNQDKYDRINTWCNADTPPTDKADLIDDGDSYSGFTPTTIRPGDNFNVWCDVRNIGTASSGGFYVSYYASMDTDISTSDYLIGTDYVNSVSPFSCSDSDWTGSFPSIIPEGTYYVGWIVDSGDDVSEFDEDNNVACKESYQLLVVLVEKTEVSIEDTSAPQGATVTVPINIAGVENMCGANIWLNYNKDVVIVDSVSDGDLVPLTYSIDNTAGVTKMTWDTTSGMTGDFVFAYVTLKAVGNSGDGCWMELDVKELYDCDLVEIPRAVVYGIFEVIAPLMEGDVTDLNVCVSLKDSTLIKFYLVDMATLTPDQLECAETNDDGEVTLKDSTAIKFWLVDPDFPLWESPADDHMMEPVPCSAMSLARNATSTTVSIEDASVPQGETVTVPINIAGVENMCGANIWLNYNKNVVIVDSVSDGDLVPLTHSIDNIAGVTKMTWDTTSGMTGDFVFAYVTLKAVGNPGDTCLLDLDLKELYDCVPPFNEIPRTVADGTFTVRADIVPKPDLIITEKWVCWPDNCTICYNVTNTGDGTAPSGHNTALYVDGVAVAHDHVPVDLAPGESYTGCFGGYDWTYTPPSDEIRVCADNNETVGETNETNNCLTNIWMCGDVTGDGRVRTSDGRRIFRHLTFGDPIDNLWAADVTGDGRVRTSDGRRIFRHLTFGDPLNCKCSG